MLIGFHEPRAGDRSADEAEADRLELAGRELRRGIARPEAVAVAGDDREAGDLLVAHEIVDFAAFDPCAAVIAAAEIGEAALWPRLLRQARREVFGIGPPVESAQRIAP